VNTSSAGAIFASALPKKHFGTPEPRSSVEVPPAFPKQKVGAAFLPPPTRKVAPDVGPEPEQAQEEEEEVGEWAEALYEYASDDPGDLNLAEGQRIKVLERTSEDWWRGEVDGREGIFPASYVQMLLV